MKTLYISLISAFLFTQSANAQFTLLEEWHGARDGHSYGGRYYDSTTAVPKAMGAGQKWDFSTLQMRTAANSSFMVTFATASAVPSASAFPGANLVATGSDYKLYYNATVQQFELLGQSSGSTITTYSNGLMQMKWPINSNTSYTDSYTVSDPEYTASGTYTFNPSGSGTVTLPGGLTYTNCMQLYSIDMNVSTETATTAITATTTTKTYMYYTDQWRFPLVTITYNSVMSGTNAPSMSVQMEVNYLLAQGLNDHNFDASFSIYPNPARESFSVRLVNDKAENCEMEFYNITGALVKKLDLGNSPAIENTVNISDLTSGVYLVKTSLGDRQSVRKLIVE